MIKYRKDLFLTDPKIIESGELRQKIQIKRKNIACFENNQLFLSWLFLTQIH